MSEGMQGCWCPVYVDCWGAWIKDKCTGLYRRAHEAQCTTTGAKAQRDRRLGRMIQALTGWAR